MTLPLLTRVLHSFRGNITHYLFVAVPAFVVFHQWTPSKVRSRKISPEPVSRAQMKREFAYSLLSNLIFALLGLLMLYLRRHGYSRIYANHRYGHVWDVLSIPVMLVIHDTWFYWTHRLLHWKPLFRHVHRIHHLSRDPTPLAAFAFHPVEAVIQGLIAPIIALTLPVQRGSFAAFVLLSLLINVLGHLGFELSPRGFMRTPLSWFLNTTMHHHQHHRKVNWNFGLYFNWWDRLLGTNHPEYVAAVEEITGDVHHP